MHLHAIPPHKVQKSPPLNVQSYSLSLLKSPSDRGGKNLSTTCCLFAFCYLEAIRKQGLAQE